MQENCSQLSLATGIFIDLFQFVFYYLLIYKICNVQKNGIPVGLQLLRV